MRATITIRVKPGSKKPGFSFEGDAIVLRVRERAVEGAANAACIRVLAGALGTAPSNVALARGHHARVKTFSVEGMSDEEAVALLTKYG